MRVFTTLFFLQIITGSSAWAHNPDAQARGEPDQEINATILTNNCINKFPYKAHEVNPYNNFMKQEQTKCLTLVPRFDPSSRKRMEICSASFTYASSFSICMDQQISHRHIESMLGCGTGLRGNSDGGASQSKCLEKARMAAFPIITRAMTLPASLAEKSEKAAALIDLNNEAAFRKAHSLDDSDISMKIKEIEASIAKEDSLGACQRDLTQALERAAASCVSDPR